MPTIAKAYDNILSAIELEEDTVNGVSSTSFKSIEFIEQSPRPADAYYFPLDVDARGYAPGNYDTKTINPVQAANLAFDGDGCWVGSAVTNLWPIKTDLQGWTGGGTIVSSRVSPMGDLKQELTKPGGSTLLQSTTDAANSLVLTSGTNYTLSSYYRHVSGTSYSPTEFKLAKSVGGTPITKTSEAYKIPTIKSQWQRGWGTATYNEATTAWPYLVWTGLDVATARFAGMMIEAKPFVSAWCLNTRGAGLLTWNLYASCGLNWNADYTIVYWKKAHGTDANGTAVGYSIDSIGRNSNTIGGGYRWWGKTAASLTYGISGTGATLTYSNYQYTWNMHVIKRTGTSLSLRVYGMGTNGLFLAQSVDDSEATANRYVTQDGRDLQLGGWDNSNPTNTYYRDLLVIPGRAMSDAELDKMYNSKLRVFTNYVAAGQMIEGII